MKKSSMKSFFYGMGLLLIFFSTTCLYDMETIRNYLICSFAAMVMIIGYSIIEGRFVISFPKAKKWILLIYTMFTIYGCLFKATPDWPYNWDFMIFTAILNLAIFESLSYFINDNKYDVLEKYVFWACTLIIGYMAFLDRHNLGMAGMRLGDSLSGNVNTVGVCLGFISILYVYLFNKNEKTKLKRNLEIVVLLILFACMLLTGSKKAVVFIAIDIFLLASNSKDKSLSVLYTVILILSAVFLIYTNSYFYSVIGYRIDSMIYSMFGIGNGTYSHSTDDRGGMILEGFRLFLRHPFFGGGEKYFAAASIRYGYYGYSHCNYVEMLCNFGLVGTILFYAPKFKNLKLFLKRRKSNYDGLLQLGIAMLAGSLIIDWMMVSYSDLCISYMPVMISFIIADKYRSDKTRHIGIIRKS